MKIEVFISYSWEEESENVVDAIYNAAKDSDILILKDKINIEYKGNIRQFMERMGVNNYIIVVLSKKYLESPNCMFELTQIDRNGRLMDRIFPIVLKSANIFDVLARTDYIKFWEEKVKELSAKLKGVDDMTVGNEIFRTLNEYKNIYTSISRLTDNLQQMNVLTPEIHKNNNYATIIDMIKADYEKKTT